MSSVQPIAVLKEGLIGLLLVRSCFDYPDNCLVGLFNSPSHGGKMDSKKRRGRRKSTGFKADHNTIDKAVENYLKNGGTIKKIDSVESSYKKFMMFKEPPTSIDDFLHGDTLF